MPICPSLNSFTTGAVISATEHNSNYTNLRDTLNTYAVLTDVARTISVTHTWTAAQTFTGGFTAAAASSIAAALTVTLAKTTLAATAAGYASLNLPHGTAPSAPANGDVWTTTGGLYAYINGATVGPLSQHSGTGTNGKLTRWTGTSALADAGATDDGTYTTNANQPRCRLTDSGGTVVAVAPTWTAISWDSAPLNVGTMYAGGNPTRVTVPASAGGSYHFEFCGVVRHTANATVSLRFRKDGTTTIGPTFTWGAHGGDLTGDHDVPIAFAWDDDPAAAAYYEVEMTTNGATCTLIDGQLSARKVW